MTDLPDSTMRLEHKKVKSSYLFHSYDSFHLESTGWLEVALWKYGPICLLTPPPDLQGLPNQQAPPTANQAHQRKDIHSKLSMLSLPIRGKAMNFKLLLASYFVFVDEQAIWNRHRFLPFIGPRLRPISKNQNQGSTRLFAPPMNSPLHQPPGHDTNTAVAPQIAFSFYQRIYIPAVASSLHERSLPPTIAASSQSSASPLNRISHHFIQYFFTSPKSPFHRQHLSSTNFFSTPPSSHSP
ncbi:unnamed protein product [Protopolystoma xenopodis]|uniref:Uncharacterized protein n=1 Tax=Protopolystoma xenopodis TaxID=117903 RepID=A0A448XMW7_9PLAT|nr:unnamed protein product [Protopolystoma xenopodis]